jgi:hypothetical protein
VSRCEWRRTLARASLLITQAVAFSLAGVVIAVRFRNSLKDTGDAI